MNDICCIGHITLDKIVTPRKTTYMPGGTSYYFSHGISHLKDIKHYQLVTALAPSEFKAVEDIRAKGIKVTVIPSHRTVYFENTYGENQDNRSQRVLAKADPFTVEQLENINAHIFHLGSLLADDFSLDVVKYLSTKGILAVDAQGYLREVRGEKVYPIDWTDKVEALKYIDILKVNEHEMEVLTGQTDIKQAAGGLQHLLQALLLSHHLLQRQMQEVFPVLLSRSVQQCSCLQDQPVKQRRLSRLQRTPFHSSCKARS